MVSMQIIEDQLKAIGADIKFWGKAEKRELQHVLVPGEQIRHCITGRYEGGFALLCATNKRLLLVDKKPFYLTLEDVRYDMISEVDFSHRLLDATVRICTINKVVRFTSFKHDPLRKLMAYVQDRVMDTRQQRDPEERQIELPAYQLNPQTQATVNEHSYQATNPYTKVPLMMRRRVSRFYS